MINKLRLKIIYRLLKYSYRFPRDILFCFLRLGYWDPSWRFYGLPLIQSHSKAKITIGKKLSACSNPYYNSLGVFQKVIIKALDPKSVITIGDNLGISGAVISCNIFISIGNNVLIGSGATITDSDAHPINPYNRNDSSQILKRPIIIEDDVFIGARSIILKGVTIGRGAIVGAGSVVTRDVASFAIVAGNPAKVIGNSLDPKFVNDLIL